MLNSIYNFIHVIFELYVWSFSNNIISIINAHESINELTLICVLIQSRSMRSGGWDKKSVAFSCVFNNKTFKMEEVECRVLNIISKMTNHSELFRFLIVATSQNTINGAGS